MTIGYDRDAKIRDSIIESQSVANQPGIVVINPDGTDVGAGGGVSEIEGKVAAGDPNTTKPVKVGAVYNTVLPTYNDGEQTDFQADENGRLITTASLSSNVPSEDPDTENPIKVGARYDATLPTYTDGDKTNLQTDINGRVWIRDISDNLTLNTKSVRQDPQATSSNTWSLDSSAALEASSVIKNSPGNIRKFSGRIDSTAPTATYYLQLINDTSVPADGAVTLLTAPIKIQHTTAEDSPIILAFPENGLHADTGLVWVLSSTEFTKTISGNYVSADVFYV